MNITTTAAAATATATDNDSDNVIKQLACTQTVSQHLDITDR